jgi:hypothetical protein
MRPAFVILLSLALLPLHAADSFTFFAIGDPQINIPRWGTAGTEQAIEWMNNLPKMPFPYGGKVGAPRGVLVIGDMVDDIKNPENWAVYKTLFDVRGQARLRYPAYESIGNHELDGANRGTQMSYVQREFIERNKLREGRFHFDPLGYHYSWDWGGVHFVMLNSFPGTAPRPVYNRNTPWNDPQNGLAFLEGDLKERVGDSGRPVVLVWHYGLRGWGLDMWWTPEDLSNLKRALAPYNVALILHGHEHRYERYQWEGYDAIMAPAPQIDRDPKAPDSVSKPKGVLVLRVRGGRLETAMYTARGWEEKWEKPLLVRAKN